jgi:hypothetical protein
MAAEILTEKSITVEAFYEALKKVQQEGEDSQQAFYVQLLISIIQYENFVQMMQNYCYSH